MDARPFREGGCGPAVEQAPIREREGSRTLFLVLLAIILVGALTALVVSLLLV